MQALTLKIKGIYSFPNNLGKDLPDGALINASNIVIDADSIAQSRRGFNRLSHAFADSAARASKYFVFQSKLLAAYSTSSLAYYDTSTGWNNYSGTFTAISATAKIRAAEANQNIYFTTSAGIQKLEAYNSTPTSSGIVKALEISGSLNAATGGFFDTNNQVGYRCLWGIKDANSNVIYGAPSGIFSLVNSSGNSKNVDLTITVPATITTAHFFQVYRSGLSGDATVSPSDELQLVYESNPSSAQISAKTITFTDQTPNSLRGASLYTSPSQEGIEQSNEQPPQAKDLTLFNGSLFYANTVSKHRLALTLLSTGKTTTGNITNTSNQLTTLAYTTGIAAGQLITGTGIPSNTTVSSIVGSTVTMSANATASTTGVSVVFTDTVTIAGTTYTPRHTETASSGQYKVYSAGTVAQNVADTTNSLVRVINQYSTNTIVYAYYISGPDDLPGMVSVEERGLGGSSFAATAPAYGSNFNPALPTSGTTVSSTNDTFLNAVYFAKNGEPEAVPLLNVFRVGSASKEILRILPLRTSLFVLKQEGIWRILGTSSANFRLEPFDSSTKLLAPETAVVLNNQIFALTDQGVAIITESGVSVVSRPIEGDLLTLFGADITAVQNYSFGVGYETDRKYILFTIRQAGDTYATQAFIFNVFTNTWTKWDLQSTAGIVNTADNKLYLADAITAYTRQERKSFTNTDFVDQMEDLNLISAAGTALTVDVSNTLAIGDLIYQSASVSSVVTAVDTINNIVTVRDRLSGWTPGTVTHYSGIQTLLEWPPQTGGNPGILKNFQEIAVFMKDRRFTSCDLKFKTDASPSFETVTITGDGGGRWGLFSWGSQPWGGQRVQGPIRTYIPLEKSRASELIVQFSAKLAFQSFALQGLSIPFEVGDYTIAV